MLIRVSRIHIFHSSLTSAIRFLLKMGQNYCSKNTLICQPGQVLTAVLYCLASKLFLSVVYNCWKFENDSAKVLLCFDLAWIVENVHAFASGSYNPKTERIGVLTCAYRVVFSEFKLLFFIVFAFFIFQDDMLKPGQAGQPGQAPRPTAVARA